MPRSTPNFFQLTIGPSQTITGASRGAGTRACRVGIHPAVVVATVLFLLTALSFRALAQTEAQIESDQVKRVGTHLSCQCGACQENLNCQMSSGQCHFCKPARTQIYEAQTKGQSDAQIIQSFITQYGDKIFRHDPNSYFWTIPYISLGLGLLAILYILRRIKTSKPGAGPVKPAVAGDPALDRYREAIEKETERLE